MTDEELQEKLDAAYSDGERAVAGRIMRELITYLGIDSPLSRLAIVEEQLRAARNAAQHVCEDVLEIPFPKDLNLADIIEKHIGRNIE